MKKILFFIMFFVFNMTCFAAHLELEVIPNVYSDQVDLRSTVFFSSNQKKYIMDSKIVYCTSPGVEIMTREYTETDISLSPISSDKLEQMKLISYYGYDYPTHKTDRYFMASQELIWELLNQEVHYTTGRYNTGSVIDIEYEKQQIMNLMNEHYTLPSFANETYEGKEGDTIELIDNNNILKEFQITTGNATIEGNKLIIKFKKENEKIHFVKKKYDNLETKYYKAQDSQDFMLLRPDDVEFDININTYTPKSNISINKTGEVLIDYQDKFIYEEKGLTGVKFNIYADEDIYNEGNLIYKKGEIVEEITTIDGNGISKELPNGNYMLKETITLDEYILDEQEYKITLNNTEKENKIYMINLNNERQKIKLHLQKVGEEFEEVILNNGTYNKIPLENIEFGLYSKNPIYSYDNNLLVQNDILLGIFKTDEKGIINASLDIPFGTYYIKEISTQEGYKIDPNIYEFSVQSNGKETNILITKEPIVNELIKGDLIIHKTDVDNNNLEGAEFKIFDDYDNLIYEGKTDELGTIRISNLSYGKYHFYETTAPIGYYKQSKLYEFYITDDGEVINIKIINEKLPVTSDIYKIPKKISTIGLGFGLATLSIAIINDEKNKNNKYYSYF